MAHDKHNSAVDPVKLERLAEVAVRVGLQLREGQDLVITAPVVALPLVRLIARHAYKAGAGLVTPFFADDAITLARYANAPDESFDRAADWLYEGMAKAYSGGAARLAIAADNPMLLSTQDAGKVSRANRANSRAYQPALEKIAGFDINWNIVSYPNPDWAMLVFPGEPEEVATRKLAEAIFAASRVDVEDPIGAWAAHNAALRTRTRFLNGKAFSALHFKGPGTDLTVGLADGHEWHGGASTAKNGITCNPNIPTEEVFTTPHALRVDGHVTSTKPLSHQGTLIENIAVRFEGGRIVEAGQAVARKCFPKCWIPTRAHAGWAKWRWCRIPRRSRKAGFCSTTRCLMKMRQAILRLANAIPNASSMARLSRRKRSGREAAIRASFTSTG
ncbi:Aminopeptidase T [Brucella ceti TE28753-12]|nr:Aminopeptidase T [Brucella ceti TE28753-12]